MTFNFNNFIVVDDSFSKRFGRQSFTVTGQQLYQIGTAIPVIRKGSGCIGIAVVEAFTVTQTATTVTFDVSKVNENDAKVYYKLYQNSLSIGESDDMSDQEDMIIPGAMLGRDRNPEKRKTRRGGSLMDYMD